MKELSINEKAQRYDEAIKLAKDSYNYPSYPGFIRADVVFPELKESEDERTWIINYLNNRILNSTILAEKENLIKAIDYLEKQGEQKPADKVEPKFKVEKGKWYVCIKDLLDNYANKAFCKGDTYLSTQDGSLIPSNSNVPFEVICAGTYFRDWTIQDAKDGDVLYSLDSCQPFIYKERKPFEQATAYCGINKYGKFFVWNTKDCIIVLEKYVPATKEQRDLLFQKMKEAGYEWDAEKKELKKIEQKSATMSLDEAIEHCKEKSCGNNACALEHKQLEKWLTELKELKEQKPAEWTGETYKPKN